MMSAHAPRSAADRDAYEYEYELPPSQAPPPVALGDRRLLTTAEAAEFLAISSSNMRKLIAAKEVRSLKLGTSRRVPLFALIEFVNNRIEKEEA